jgi:hypothetical protein
VPEVGEQERAADACRAAKDDQTHDGERQRSAHRQKGGQRKGQDAAGQHGPQVVVCTICVRRHGKGSDEAAGIVDSEDPPHLGRGGVEEGNQQECQRRVEERELEPHNSAGEGTSKRFRLPCRLSTSSTLEAFRAAREALPVPVSAGLPAGQGRFWPLARSDPANGKALTKPETGVDGEGRTEQD